MIGPFIRTRQGLAPLLRVTLRSFITNTLLRDGPQVSSLLGHQQAAIIQFHDSDRAGFPYAAPVFVSACNLGVKLPNGGFSAFPGRNFEVVESPVSTYSSRLAPSEIDDSFKSEKKKEFMKSQDVVHTSGGDASDDCAVAAGGDQGDLWIFFDIEATGRFSNFDEMTQLAAMAVYVLNNGVQQTVGQPFSTYVRTVKEIPAEVEKLTGIKSFRHPDSPLRSAPAPEKALALFTSWVEGVTKEVNHRKRVLVGHNIQSFDLRLIAKQLMRAQLNFEEEMAKRKVTSYLDSYRYLQRVKTLQFPHKLKETAGGKGSLTQESIYGALFNAKPDDAHRAFGDVKSLLKIMRHPIMASHFNSKTEVASLKDLARAILDPGKD